MIFSPADDAAYIKTHISAIKEEVPGVKTFFLEPEKEIVYQAGQFLTFVFRDAHGEERRSYSITSSPILEEPLSVTVKRLVNGKYSRPLIDGARVNDVLVATNATGQFILPPNISDYKQVFFFAAGIGITPIFSLIKTILHQQKNTEVILIYSNTSQKQAAFYEELLQLHHQFRSRFHLEFLFSSSPDLSRARLSKWLLPQLLTAYTKSTRTEQLFYTCGPNAYMRMVLLTLEELGYTEDQVRKENFDTSKPAVKAEPPDKDTHNVLVTLNEREYQFAVQYPQTILQSAKAHGILLPFSCETGKCGSCTGICTSGKVWLSYNEVLTEKDIKQGKVLTCVGYPVGGDVVIRL